MYLLRTGVMAAPNTSASSAESPLTVRPTSVRASMVMPSLASASARVSTSAGTGRKSATDSATGWRSSAGSPPSLAPDADRGTTVSPPRRVKAATSSSITGDAPPRPGTQPLPVELARRRQLHPALRDLDDLGGDHVPGQQPGQLVPQPFRAVRAAAGAAVRAALLAAEHEQGDRPA